MWDKRVPKFNSSNNQRFRCSNIVSTNAWKVVFIFLRAEISWTENYGWRVGRLRLSVALFVCQFPSYYSHFNNSILQTSHTGGDRPEEDLIRCSRSWHQRSRSQRNKHGNIVNSTVRNGWMDLKLKAKARDSYIARVTGKPDQLRFTIIGNGSWSARASGAAVLNAAVYCTC